MGIFDTLDKALDQRLNGLKKAEVPEVLEKAMKEDGYGRKGLIFDPFGDQGYSGGLFRPKGQGSGLISNLILKIVYRRNPIVSTIVHIKASQVQTFCRPQANRFDTGFVINAKKKGEEDESEIKEIEEYISRCGRTDERSHEDELSFSEFGYMVTADQLVYGHAAIEKVKDNSGALYCFLPIPGETIYFANRKLSDKKMVKDVIEVSKDTWRQTHGELNKEIEPDAEDYEYLQVINGKVVNGFTRDDLIFSRIYTQGDIDLNGYTIGPLERAIGMITAHLQIENHQKMFFTHGVASRGLLVIQGDVTPNQLRTLQAQWTNQVTGPHTAWRTPILAGIKGVQWQPLTMANRDMEYAAYQDHVLRTIHSCFGVDPEETGFGYLSKGTEQRSLGESSNEWKISNSKERSLRPLLNRIETLINHDILPAWNPAYAEKYEFCFVGLDAETREEEIARLQSEVQLHTTINEVRNQAGLQELAVGGGLILNPLLLATLQSNMPKGVFMERFMGIAGAADRPDLQYIPDPLWFQWQQLQMSMMQQQAQAQAGAAPQGGGDGSGGGGQEQPEGQSEDQDQQSQQDQKAQQAQAAQQQAQAQAQSMAIDQFMQANPELFKSMVHNLKKSEFHDAHVDEMRDALIRDFDKAAEKLMDDIMAAIEKDIESRDETEDK